MDCQTGAGGYVSSWFCVRVYVCVYVGAGGGVLTRLSLGWRCRGHHQECLDEGMCMCACRSVMFYYVIGGAIAPLVYVEKGAAVCHCLCLFKSCQLFLCGVGAVLYRRAVAMCDAVAGPISVLYVSVVMCLSFSVCESGHPSRPLCLDGSSGVPGNDPQQSTVVLYLQPFSALLPLTCLLGGWAVLRRPGAMSCLPHSLCLG